MSYNVYNSMCEGQSAKYEAMALEKSGNISEALLGYRKAYDFYINAQEAIRMSPNPDSYRIDGYVISANLKICKDKVLNLRDSIRAAANATEEKTNK